MPPTNARKSDRLTAWDWLPCVIWNECLCVVLTLWELNLLLHGRLALL